MANNLPFQQPIDLITEREMVYDIFERSKLGHDLKDLDNTYFRAGTFLTDLIKKFIYMLPHTLVLNFLNVKVGEIHVAAGSKTGSCTISGLNEGKVILAYSQQMQIDVSENINTVGSNNLLCTIATDVPYLKDDYIKVYAI